MMNSNVDVQLLVKLFFKELGLRSTYITRNNLSYREEGHPALIGNPITWFFLWNLVTSMKHCQPLFFFFSHIFHWGGTQLSYQTRVNPAWSGDFS